MRRMRRILSARSRFSRLPPAERTQCVSDEEVGNRCVANDSEPNQTAIGLGNGGELPPHLKQTEPEGPRAITRSTRRDCRSA
jgi:hypothetical protein